MKFPRIARLLPSWKSALLSILAAILLILAFPDFEYWFLAGFALVPLLMAVEREKDSAFRSFIIGWLFGVVFFFGTCWWLAYAPIHYAGFPPLLAYSLVFCGTAAAGVFPGVFASIASKLIREFGDRAYFAVPFVWVATEFARYWLSGNDWNALGYSQAFALFIPTFAQIGGVLSVSFVCASLSTAFHYALKNRHQLRAVAVSVGSIVVLGVSLALLLSINLVEPTSMISMTSAYLVAVQPNVPMSGLTEERWNDLRFRQTAAAEDAIRKHNDRPGVGNSPTPTLVVLPESPMNYQWTDDPDFREFIARFATKNDVAVLFNSAEPDPENNKYFNSAVMIDASGHEVLEYDKIYLLPFGEAVPAPLESLVPGFVGNFSYGRNYNLVPLGDAKAGIMICFESHFGQLSREYVRRGADAIIEMTNDGYLGPTPVLRQHLANAVFRAIETNRPVFRVTNVGITAYITERGEILDSTKPYIEDAHVWTVEKSDGSQTFYVKYGDWFAWVSSAVTIFLLVFSFLRRRPAA